MTIKNTLCALVAAATIGLAGCNECDKRPVEKIQGDITIFGKPLSVAYLPNTHSEHGSFAAIFNVKGKILLTYVEENNLPKAFSYAKASALIQSEINDEDDEDVKLTGQYKGTGFDYEFKLSSIEANGYEVNLKE